MYSRATIKTAAYLVGIKTMPDVAMEATGDFLPVAFWEERDMEVIS